MHIQLAIISRLKAAPSEAKGKGRQRERRQLSCLKSAPEQSGPKPRQGGGKKTLSWRNAKAGWLELALRRASY